MLLNAGKITIKHNDYKTLLGMRVSIQAHPAASKLIEEGVAEQTIIWREQGTSLLCKARPDLLPNRNKRTLIDLKTTRDASSFQFLRSVLHYGYHRQAAFYLDALYNVKVGRVGKNRVYDSFVIIAVETAAPYHVECYALDEELIEVGRREYIELLKLELDCRAKDFYPNYKDAGIQTLEKPIWL
jgi:hypothetical protein